MDVKSVRRKLMSWYKREGRTLPWRETTNPYHIFLSELMLQQTQVSRGLIYFDQFTKKFPNWEALAKAKRSDVLKVWSGLGYNRRAIFIHEAAKQIVEGGVPDSQSAWLKIKGVGKYTAAALTVFSLRKKAYPVDTNIRRVIGRVFLKKYFAQIKDDAKVEQVMERLMDAKPFHDIPQALFDLSTAYCQPKPACLMCPLADLCPSADAFMSGKVKIEKQKKAKEKIETGKRYPDRIYRGRILKYIMDHPGASVSSIGPHIDTHFSAKDAAWLEGMVNRMKRDKLIRVKAHKLYLA